MVKNMHYKRHCKDKNIMLYEKHHAQKEHSYLYMNFFFIKRGILKWVKSCLSYPDKGGGEQSTYVA